MYRLINSHTTWRRPQALSVKRPFVLTPSLFLSSLKFTFVTKTLAAIIYISVSILPFPFSERRLITFVVSGRKHLTVIKRGTSAVAAILIIRPQTLSFLSPLTRLFPLSPFVLFLKPRQRMSPSARMVIATLKSTKTSAIK